MEYFSSNKFIPKLETENYLIGSMDIFIEDVKKTIDSYSKTLDIIRYFRGDELLNLLPVAHRASVVSKESGEYVGFISTIDVDNRNSIASIHFEADKKLVSDDINKLIDTYEEYLANSLNITKINDLVILNKNLVVLEEGNFKAEPKTLSDPRFESRNIR